MIKGLFETHINVSNLEASAKFYGEVLGLELALFEKARRIVFFWMGKRGESMLGLWEKPQEQVISQHFAFRCEIADILNHSVDYLKARDLTSYNFLKDGNEKPMVFAWMPAISIYFRDPDNHELEFIAMLPDKPKSELGIVSFEDWEVLKDK